MAAKWVLGVAGAAVAAGVAVLVLRETAPDPAGPPSDKPAGGPIVAVTLPAELSPAGQIGKRGFDAKCATCHGADAAGQEGVAPPLVHKYYEPGHHSDVAFQRAVRLGVKQHHWSFGDMAPVDGLTDADIKAITAYVRELQRANGIE